MAIEKIETKNALLWKRFCEHNSAGLLAKWILSDNSTRSAQVESVKIVFQDGVEFKIDARTSKAFKRFKHKIKDKAKRKNLGEKNVESN